MQSVEQVRPASNLKLKSPAPMDSRKRPVRVSWIRRVAVGLISTILVLLGMGVLYQTIGTALDQRRFPAPGQMVDVGGHRLHVQSQGAGGPAVILEAGHGASSTQFAWLMPELAEFSQVYAYDRAGYGWSDEARGDWSVESAADELLVLLQSAGIQGPYVLVSHSLGGMIHRAFAAKYPEQVAGLVMLDPTGITDVPGLMEAQLSMHKQNKTLAAVGVARLGFSVGLFPGPTSMPEEAQPIILAKTLPNKHWRASLREFTALVEQTHEPAVLRPEIPVTVISANKLEGGEGLLPGGMTAADVLAMQLEQHEKWVAESAVGRHVVLDGADHAAAGGMASEYVPQIVDEIRRMTDTTLEANTWL